MSSYGLIKFIVMNEVSWKLYVGIRAIIPQWEQQDQWRVVDIKFNDGSGSGWDGGSDGRGCNVHSSDLMYLKSLLNIRAYHGPSSIGQTHAILNLLQQGLEIFWHIFRMLARR